MDVLRWDEEPREQLSPAIGRRMLNGEAMTLAEITLATGAVVPEHEHPNEQIATVLSGRLRFVVGGEEREVGPGESVLIPGGVPHRVEVLEDAVVLDVFAPRREDWIRGDDAYLRGS
jgi:quercetin dioxygenase-like cupin family protein